MDAASLIIKLWSSYKSKTSCQIATETKTELILKRSKCYEITTSSDRKSSNCANLSSKFSDVKKFLLNFNYKLHILANVLRADAFNSLSLLFWSSLIIKGCSEFFKCLCSLLGNILTF